MDGFDLVHLQNIHLQRYSELSLIESHRDPFDRLLIATAIKENAIILTADEKFKYYTDLISVIW